MRHFLRQRFEHLRMAGVRAPGWLQRLALAGGGVVILLSALFLGTVFVILFVGLALIGGLALSVATWWHGRKLAGERQRHGAPHERHGETLETSYRVIDRDKKE